MTHEQFSTLVNLAMLFALLSALALWWMVRFGGRRGRIAQRTREVVALAPANVVAFAAADDAAPTWQERLVARLAAVGDRIPLFDAKQRLKLSQEMVRAGYRNKNVVSVLVGVKLVVGLVCATTVVMFGSHVPHVGQYPLARGVMMIFAFMIGMIFPEYMVAYRSSQRRKTIASCLPDALDLLVICTNAGNSLAVSIRRVAGEMASICPPLAAEFALTADELKVSGDSARALMSLAERVDLTAVQALVSTVLQSMHYGTPITQALRTLSRTERLAHMLALEEKAAKLAPKMVVPMMIFILPAVVAIAAGPAAIQLMAFMGHK